MGIIVGARSSAGMASSARLRLKGLANLPCACRTTGDGAAQRAGAHVGAGGSCDGNAQKGPFAV